MLGFRKVCTICILWGWDFLAFIHPSLWRWSGNPKEVPAQIIHSDRQKNERWDLHLFHALPCVPSKDGLTETLLISDRKKKERNSLSHNGCPPSYPTEPIPNILFPLPLPFDHFLSLFFVISFFKIASFQMHSYISNIFMYESPSFLLTSLCHLSPPPPILSLLLSSSSCHPCFLLSSSPPSLSVPLSFPPSIPLL